MFPPRLRLNYLKTVPATLPLLLGMAHPARAQVPTYRSTQAPLEARVADLMSQLTQDEKIRLLSGTDFTTQPIARLGIPALAMADAGQGVRGGSSTTQGPATAFPAGFNMASSWNPALVARVAAAIGTEAQNKGTGAQVLLGPAVNIQRTPLGGRNGEYFSEDPFLAARLAVAYIRAMQATGTVACLKHFAANNQEIERNSIDAQVSERALREIYLPAFEAGVKEGGAWTIMSSYNRLNGEHSTANSYLLSDILKRGWGFDGMVMSDWGAVHETAAVINAGNDLEMPGPGLLAPDKVKSALALGQVTPAQVDENARRIVRTILRSGLLDGSKTPNPALVNSAANREIALQGALESLILLKNQRQTLPLNARRIKSIALIGPAAREFQIGALGSPGVTPLRAVGLLEGIQTRVGSRVAVRTSSGIGSGSEFPAGILRVPGTAEAGFRAEYFAGTKLEGAPILTRTEAQIGFESAPQGIGPNDFSARWTATLTPRKSGLTTFSFRADDGSRLFLDGKPLIAHWQNGAAATQVASIQLRAGQKYEIRAEFYQAGGAAVAQLRWLEAGTEPFAEAVALARQSDVAIVCVSTRGTEGEGNDRPSMALPENQDALIAAVAAANPRTVVVLNTGTPVSMPWLATVPALIEAGFPGQEGGRALAQVLFGDTSPSGHLPTTFAARREDYPDLPNYPGQGGREPYAEGIYVGYRAFDKRQIAPLFPFGYGLSYTSFRIDNLKLSAPTLFANGRLSVSARVTNTGARAGAQVVQLYVRDLKPQTDKAVRELKGFAKVFLAPKTSQIVTLQLTPRDFAWCDVKSRGWRVDEGNYALEIGDSSRNLTLGATVRLASYFEPIPFMRGESAGAVQPYWRAIPAPPSPMSGTN